MNQAEEDLLVMAAQSGNVRAFEYLFRHYHRPLLRFAGRHGADPELAQEAVQEAWIRIAGKLRRLNDPRAFRSWLYRQVRWRVLDGLKKPRLPVEALKAEAAAEQAAACEPAPESVNALGQAIKKLSEIDRVTLDLFYVQELKIQEIAIVLEIPEGTVKSRLNRARSQLRALLDAESSGY